MPSPGALGGVAGVWCCGVVPFWLCLFIRFYKYGCHISISVCVADTIAFLWFCWFLVGDAVDARGAGVGLC